MQDYVYDGSRDRFRRRAMAYGRNVRHTDRDYVPWEPEESTWDKVGKDVRDFFDKSKHAWNLFRPYGYMKHEDLTPWASNPDYPFQLKSWDHLKEVASNWLQGPANLITRGQSWRDELHRRDRETRLAYYQSREKKPLALPAPVQRVLSAPPQRAKQYSLPMSSSNFSPKSVPIAKSDYGHAGKSRGEPCLYVVVMQGMLFV